MRVSSQLVKWAGIVLLVAGLGYLDDLTGYNVSVSPFYFIPIGLSVWYLGVGASVVVACGCALAWVSADFAAGHDYPSPVYVVWNVLIRLCSFGAIAFLVGKVRALVLLQQAKLKALREALHEIRALKGLLSICASCKRIKDEHGQWQVMEVYISDRSDAEFSHGMCPECARKAYAEAGLEFNEPRLPG